MLETSQLINQEVSRNGHSGAPEKSYENRIAITIDGVLQQTSSGELLVDVINRSGIQLPQVCYHPQLGPIQTCDTCMVEINGELVAGELEREGVAPHGEGLAHARSGRTPGAGQPRRQAGSRFRAPSGAVRFPRPAHRRSGRRGGLDGVHAGAARAPGPDPPAGGR